MMLAFLAAIGLVSGYLGVAGVRAWAARRGVMDMPNERSSHSIPTPKGGGIVFFPIALIALPFAAGGGGRLMAFLGLAALVAAVSWLDDLQEIRAGRRLAVHATLAIAAVLALGAWASAVVPSVGELRLGVGGTILTIVWIVGLTNAYNFMDGIDGIAGSQGVVAFTAWLLLAHLAAWPVVGAFACLMAAACVGFLAHNRPPARIFMGDVGSAFLGYSLAVMPLLADPADPLLPATAAWLVAPFVIDTIHTFVRRLVNGENVLEPHRSHLYQRLVVAGWSHGRVVVFYSALALAGAALGIIWWISAGSLAWIHLLALFGLYTVMVVTTRRAEAYHAHRPRVTKSPTNLRYP
jgi:Fuc2NAc and GlcNAc transferase